MSDGVEIIDSHIIEKFMKDMTSMETLYRHVRSVKINNKNSKDLEALINLLEIQEDCIRTTRRIIQLKQFYYFMSYLKSDV